MQTISAAVLDDLAPQGVLRAAINLGNPVLAQAGPGGKPQGASVELAAALARELDVALELVTYDAAGKVFADRQRRPEPGVYGHRAGARGANRLQRTLRDH